VIIDDYRGHDRAFVSTFTPYDLSSSHKIIVRERQIFDDLMLLINHSAPC
jgi:hypothetical protein